MWSFQLVTNRTGGDKPRPYILFFEVRSNRYSSRRWLGLAIPWALLWLFGASCSNEVVVPAGGGGCGDACACPAEPPLQGDPCTAVGLGCSYPENFVECWDGRVRCGRDGRWDRHYELPAVECPADLPSAYDRCRGRGSCTYPIDAGCGPDVIDVACFCLDSARLWQRQRPPQLCDCTAIESRATCTHFEGECSWDEEAGRCVPR
jgi:hypothetical protein